MNAKLYAECNTNTHTFTHPHSNTLACQSSGEYKSLCKYACWQISVEYTDEYMYRVFFFGGITFLRAIAVKITVNENPCVWHLYVQYSSLKSKAKTYFGTTFENSENLYHQIIFHDKADFWLNRYSNKENGLI